MIFYYVGYDDCENQSSELFKKWMRSNDPDTNNPIDSSLRKTGMGFFMYTMQFS